MSHAQLLDAPRRDGPSSPAPSTDGDSELQIDEVVFAPSGKVDPADRVRASLDKLVAAAKRRKEARQSAPGGGGAGKRNKPSLRPGPVQVIMGWMDQFQEHERIQVRLRCVSVHACFMSHAVSCLTFAPLTSFAAANK